MSTGLLIISCGGTFDKAKFTRAGKFVCGDPAASQLLTGAGVDAAACRVESLLRKDSLAMDDADRAAVLAAVTAAPEHHVVIVHGTDTLVETAASLDGAVGDKTVVLVGALRPAIFTDSDAAFNLGYAIAQAQVREAGVWVAMHGRTWRAGEVRKDTDAYRFVDAN